MTKALNRASQIHKHYSYGVASDEQLTDPAFLSDHRHWSNPLESQLPKVRSQQSLLCMH